MLITGSLTVRTTVSVSGSATFGQNLTASGLRVSNNTILNNALIVSGNSTFGSNLSTSGLSVSNNTLLSNLLVSGNATFGQNISISGLRVSQNASISGTLNVLGNITFANNLTVSGLRVSQNISISGSTTINTLTVSGSSIFNSKVRINITQLPDYIGLGRGALAINNGTTGGEAMIAYKSNLTIGSTFKQWDMGVNDSGRFVLESHRMDDYINTVMDVGSLDTLTPPIPTINFYGEVNAQSQNSTVATALRAQTSFNGTNGDIAVFTNNFNGQDAWISINNSSTTGQFDNSMRLGVDATGDLCIEDESFRRMLEFNVSGYCKLFDGLVVQANSQAFPGAGGGIGKGIFMKYSTAGSQDQGYIQSINRTTSQQHPLVIQSSQMWLNGDRNASAIVPAGVNVVGVADNFGTTGANMNFYTSASNYPGLSIMNYNNNNIFMGFDMYYDGTNFRASSSNAQYCIYKLSGELLFGYDNSAQGATCNATDYAMKIQLNGGCVFNYAQTNNVKVNSPYFSTNFSGLTGIAGFPSRIIASAPLAAEWIAAFNQNDAGTGSRGVIFTRSGTILGSVRYDAGGVAYLTTSDRRAKDNIRPYCCGLGMIRRLNPVLYDWKVDGSPGQGFIADELQEVVPEAVYGTKDGVNEDGTPDYQSVDLTKIIPCMVKSIQQLDTKVEGLGGADFSTLIEENRILKERLDALEAKLKKAFII
jgi:hypothetical protein